VSTYRERLLAVLDERDRQIAAGPTIDDLVGEAFPVRNMCHRRQGVTIKGTTAKGYAISCRGRTCTDGCGHRRAEGLYHELAHFYGDQVWYSTTDKLGADRLASVVSSRKVSTEAGLCHFPSGIITYHSLSRIELPGMALVTLDEALRRTISDAWKGAEKGRKTRHSKAFRDSLTSCYRSATKGDSREVDDETKNLIIPEHVEWDDIEAAAARWDVALSGTHRAWVAKGDKIWIMLEDIGAWAPNGDYLTGAERAKIRQDEALRPVPF
jgi:hypothetical protein